MTMTTAFSECLRRARQCDLHLLTHLFPSTLKKQVLLLPFNL